MSEFGWFIDFLCIVNEENGIILKGKYESEFFYDYVFWIILDIVLGCVGILLGEIFEI